MAQSADEMLGIELADHSATYEALAEFDSALVTQRHRAHSRDRSVEATVDGKGQLVDLKIDERALHGPHRELIGPAIVEAVSAGRLQASQSAQEELPKFFQPDQEKPRPAEAISPPPVAERTHRPGSRPVVQRDVFTEEEPLYQGLDAEEGNHW